MPTTSNKQKLLNHLCSACKAEGETVSTDSLPVLEQFIYGLCREGATREQADRAFRALQENFFDWNEVRVSSLREIEEAFDGLPDTERRAERLISFLQEVFETTFSFDLEVLHKKGGVKQAAKHLTRYQAANPFVVSWVVRHSLGGHAIPLDAPTLRTCRRLGLIDENQEDAEAVQASLEHLVPKARGSAFSDAVSRLANDSCWEHEPQCPTCPLSSDCPTGRSSQEPVGAGRAGRVKPR